MKGKLIKREKGYVLISEDGTQPLGSTLSKAEGRKLSLNNCLVIERDYDLEDLATNAADNYDSSGNWHVEIVEQCLDPTCDGVNRKGECITTGKPKLDADGCLILKRIK